MTTSYIVRTYDKFCDLECIERFEMDQEEYEDFEISDDVFVAIWKKTGKGIKKIFDNREED